MEKHLGKDIKCEKQREEFLKDNCEKVEIVGYMKPFTLDEMQIRKEKLANLSINLQDIENEKKAAAISWKIKITPLLEERKKMISDIKQKSEFVSENCYKFVDRDNRLTGFYNSEGDLVMQRQATADELQLTLFVDIQKTGTNN